MRKLTLERLRQLLSYNPETGIFTWLACRRGTIKTGDTAGGYTDKGYLTIKVDGVKYCAHRLAWLYVYGEFTDGDLDHKDQKKDNNRIGNLRIVTRSQNQQNRPLQSNNTTGLRGVYRCNRTNKWRAHIKTGGHQKHLGSFDTAEAAYAAYCSEAAKVHTHRPGASNG